jgi:hypothetical protein
MSQHLETAWHGADLVVRRSGIEIDRVPTQQIQRVIVACRRGGETASNLAFAIIETATDHMLLPADSGIAGRLFFERQAMWSDKACIYWVDESAARLPHRVRPWSWVPGRKALNYVRLPRTELESRIARWSLEGPQTWEQRKWHRIASNRPLASQVKTEPQARPVNDRPVTG